MFLLKNNKNHLLGHQKITFVINGGQMIDINLIDNCITERMTEAFKSSIITGPLFK